jgi:outer membrane protein OmpA-like peptidoglycan-associated protein
MTPTRRALQLAIVGAGLAWSCAGSQQLRTPEAPGQTLIVLLPDAETAAVGGASVSNPAGQTSLAGARETTIISTNGPPGPVTVMSESEVRRIFGDVLDTLPPAPEHFTMFFRFESDEPNEESRALVPKILQAVKGRPFPEVAVVGHTDTMGTPASNFTLALRRATSVRDLLVAAGLDAASVELVSHGESELLIATGDEVPEGRNRRVEISIR